MNIKRYFAFKNIIFFTLLLIFIWFVVAIKEVALLFFAAYVVACSLIPLVDRLAKKMNRASAAGIIVLVVSFLVTLVFIPIVVVSVKEAISFIDNIPEKISTLKTFLESASIKNVQLSSFISFDDISNSISELAKNVLSGSINITMAATEYIAIGLSVIMIVFYILLDKKSMENKLIEFFPPRAKNRAREILSAIEDKVGGYVIAQGLSMCVVGTVTAIGLLIFKIKYAVVLGLIAGILDIIPIIGPILAFVLGALAALQVGWLYIIPVAFVYIGAQWLSNQIIRPIVFSRFMDLHPIFIIFAFLVCAKFLGVWGVILAPAITSLFTVLIDELYLKTINNGEIPSGVETNDE